MYICRMPEEKKIEGTTSNDEHLTSKYLMLLDSKRAINNAPFETNHIIGIAKSTERSPLETDI